MSEKDEDIEMALRLVEERGRIGYSVKAFADRLEITREALRRYEIGATKFSANFLREAASLGVDVQYVVMGVRSANLPKAAGLPEQVEAAAPVLAPVVNIRDGSTNVVGVVQAGGTVTQIHSPRVVNKTVAEVHPGEEHISEKQAAKLTELVNEIVHLESLAKKTPKTHRAVWAGLNAKCKVTRYRLILSRDYEMAESYLRQWIGRLSGTPRAKAADGAALRNRRIAYIKINTRESEAELKAYLGKNFGVGSIADLNDVELERVYRWVASARSRSRLSRV